MLNILMTFAQYEREIIADRVRDRVAAAKKKGMHCGGYPVLGYDVNPVTHKLEINEKEAEIVRFVFDQVQRVRFGKRGGSRTGDSRLSRQSLDNPERYQA